MFFPFFGGTQNDAEAKKEEKEEEKEEEEEEKEEEEEEEKEEKEEEEKERDFVNVPLRKSGITRKCIVVHLAAVAKEVMKAGKWLFLLYPC